MTRMKRSCARTAAMSIVAVLAACCCLPAALAAQSLDDLSYRDYPRRTADEAAVLEWGFSAVISAVDASVAFFGPQTPQAALLEVECQPVLASPLNGILETKDDDEDETDEGGTTRGAVEKLDNADDVHGNMIVMTNTGNLTGIEMAKIAKASGAAALLVVNIDESHPDDIYRLEVEEGEEEVAETIDFPVVMISLNSANVLTTATVTPEMSQDEIVNHGMPERVRLYAGGDRPFFEDVEPVDPTLYLIHNLLTEEECDDLITTAEHKVERVEKDNLLLLSTETEKLHKIDRTVLWKGALQTHAGKQIEERIEQVTGFPAAHFSDFVIDRLEIGSYWNPHFDAHPSMDAMATITVFLTDEGSPVVYPSCKEPVKVLPRKGMAIVHHNTNEKHQLDMSTLYAILPPATAGPVYVARKYVFASPVSNSRRIVLPLVAAPLGGKLPGFVVTAHDFMIGQFGVEQGGAYFDKLCIFLPVLMLLGLGQFISERFQATMKKSSKATKSTPKGKKAD